MVHSWTVTALFQQQVAYSALKKLFTAVPHGCVLGPLIFNIFLNDISYFDNYTNIYNFTVDETPYSNGQDFNEVC